MSLNFQDQELAISHGDLYSIVDFWHAVQLKLTIHYSTLNLYDASFHFCHANLPDSAYRTCASTPPAISSISPVIACWRALL